MQPENIYSWIGSLTSLYDFISIIVGYRKSVRFFVSQLPFPKDASFRVLDAGWGTGVYSLAILEQYKNSSIVAFDFSEKMIQGFREKVSDTYTDRLRLFTADIQSPLHEIEHEMFDLVLTGGVLEYVPQKETVKNLSRFLKPNGYFFNSPVRDTYFGKIVCAFYACKPYSRKENIQSFIDNGFSLEKIISLSPATPASFKEGHLFKKIHNLDLLLLFCYEL